MDADDITMPQKKIYEKRTALKCTIEQVQSFHQRSSVLSTLTPPPIFVQVHRDERVSLTEGDVDFTLWLGPIPVRWVARHLPGPTEHSFTDQMVKGPMEYWNHDHIFEPTDNGTKLIDRITFAHKPGWHGWLTRLVFDGIPLRILFLYRHLRTRMALRK
jgi:ligand-binding SRPBCC domain-containing protein